MPLYFPSKGRLHIISHLRFFHRKQTAERISKNIFESRNLKNCKNLKMRTTSSYYPCYNNSTQLCSYGNNAIQMPPPIADISLNVCESSFFHDSQVCNDIHLGSFAPMSTMEIPQSFNTLHHLPGWLTSTANTTAASTLDKTCQLYGQSRSSVPDMDAAHEDFQATENGRKRKMKCESMEEKSSMDELKKNKVQCMEDCRNTQERQLENQEKKAPVKRSQKISDKITALQKLVSPFGKTDTASVLQEACTYIKYLHEQIEMLSAPYFSITPLHSQGNRKCNWDLSSRGLSLVPVSFTKDLTKADQVERSASRGATVSRKY